MKGCGGGDELGHSGDRDQAERALLLRLRRGEFQVCNDLNDVREDNW
jgi:hypothetical protein